MKRLNVVLIISMMTWLNIGYAEEYETVDFGERTPTDEELVDALSPHPQLKVRGIVHNSGSGSQSWQGLPQTTQSMLQEKPRAVSMQIQFDYKSAKLTPDAKNKLDAVASALQSGKLANYKFIIEGHTDSVGSANYNKKLSQERAQSAIRYMNQHHGVPLNRLQAVGKGMEEPANPSDPKAPVNRRVVIANTGSL